MTVRAMRHNQEHFTIRTTLRKGGLPQMSFRLLKERVLGSRYTLSVVFVGDTISRRLNKTYRGKPIPANVLSFPLSKTEGEIFINPRQARRDAPRYHETLSVFIARLFIHGMLHLKGYSHGSRMEGREGLLIRTHIRA